MSEEHTEKNTVERKKRKVRVGEVTSNAMDKTIAVRVSRKFKHELYGKYLNHTKKYLVHDEHNDCNVGDKVEIMETRPYSKRKRWRLVEILQRAR